jgi:alpha-beta hydrolase superfamily lysophospholipase
MGGLKMAEKIKRKKKPLKILLISLLGFVLIFSIVSMIFIKIIYDKQFARADKPAFLGYIQYGDIKGYERSVVKFESGENTLTGYIYGENNTKGLVVIAHGLGGGAESYLPETMYFVDKGWRVFSFDCTGSYESEGEGTMGLPQSVIDLDAAMSYIESNNTLKDLPRMLYGHSWGGYAVTAILNYTYPIKAAASIAGFSSPMELLAESAEGMMGVFSYLEYPYEWAYQTMIFGSDASITAVDGINNTDTPVMIIHGDKDEQISYNGSGIIAHKDEITNPNVIYKTCSIEGRNGHNNLYISEAASKYIDEKNEEYKVLYESYDGKIPDEAKAKYYEGVDKSKTSELDMEFMNEINDFFEKQLE